MKGITPIIAAAVLCSFSFLFPMEGEFNVIKNPKPTFTEKTAVPLKLTGQSEENENDKIFMARPGSMAVDSDSNLFIYDTKQVQIFKYNKDLKAVKTAGRKGEGPGEFKVFGGQGRVVLYFANKKLYAYNDMSSKILTFDSNLNLKDEQVYQKRYHSRQMVVDNCDNIYFNDVKEAIHVVDQEMNIKWKLLEKNQLFDFIFFEAPEGILKNPFKSRLLPMNFEMSNGTDFIVYSPLTANIFVFRKNQLIRKIACYSQPMLDKFKIKLEKSRAMRKKIRERRRREDKRQSGFSLVYIYVSFFMDKDDQRFFYLQYNNKENKSIKLYRFSLEGKLDSVYVTDVKEIVGKYIDIYFKTKKSRSFYAMNRDGKIFKFAAAKGL